MLTFEKITITQGPFAMTADFTLPEGSFTALIGPSGAGKSTLLSTLAGFWPQSSGRLLWKGRDLTPLPAGERPLSILFQDNNLFPHLTLAQNLALGLKGKLRLTSAEKDLVAATLADVGLEGLENRKPAALSGGQQSRAALARLLLEDRPLVLMDEPFAALGPAMRREMLALAADRLAGRTLLMVSHDPEDAAQICDLVVVVANGLCEAPRPTQEALSHPSPALASYLG